MELYCVDISLDYSVNIITGTDISMALWFPLFRILVMIMHLIRSVILKIVTNILRIMMAVELLVVMAAVSPTFCFSCLRLSVNIIPLMCSHCLCASFILSPHLRSTKNRNQHLFHLSNDRKEGNELQYLPASGLVDPGHFQRVWCKFPRHPRCSPGRTNRHTYGTEGGPGKTNWK